MSKLLGYCPTCDTRLKAKVLKCNACGLEMSNDFELSLFDYLSKDNTDFLLVFLRNQGNMKALQDELNISYPYAKKKLEQVLIELGLFVEEEKLEPEEIDVTNLQADTGSTLASEIIKSKLKDSGGRTLVRSISGKTYEIRADIDGKSFSCNQLPMLFEYTVFDVIVNLLIQQGGRAKKGNGRNYKLGEPGCEDTTVVGAVAKNYSGKKDGDSIFDPVFILVSVLEWANISHNCSGYIELTPSYRVLSSGK